MMRQPMARSRRRSDVTVRNASVHRDRTDPHTTVRRHLADAQVVLVSHENVATRIDGYAQGISEAGV